MSLKERIYSILIVSATDSFTSAFADLLPEARYTEKFNISGDAKEQANGIFDVLKARKLI